jgi:hypothetical protein
MDNGVHRTSHQKMNKQDGLQILLFFFTQILKKLQHPALQHKQLVFRNGVFVFLLLRRHRWGDSLGFGIFFISLGKSGGGGGDDDQAVLYGKEWDIQTS